MDRWQVDRDYTDEMQARMGEGKPSLVAEDAARRVRSLHTDPALADHLTRFEGPIP